VLRFVPDGQVGELFGACDAVVVSRADGGTSGALILALSQGRPCVAADCSSYRELLDDGAAGWLFEPGNVASLAEALELAAASPQRAEEKGRRAAEIASRLDWRTIVSGLARVLDGAPDRTRVRSGRG
jgi:phosphatidylinositol alpha-mannosyltransferase